MKTVFILGAGASKQAGAPLMSEFIDKAEELHRLKPEGTYIDEEAFKDVLDAQKELQAIHAKSFLDLNNIEILFGAIEMGLLLNKLGTRTSESIEKLRSSIKTFIVQALEYSIKFPVHDGRRILPPPPYNKFVDMLSLTKDDENAKDPNEFAFLTFNYDLALDRALFFIKPEFDYCLTDKKTPDKHPYLKLHGSINWGTCEKCGIIIPKHTTEAESSIAWLQHHNYVYYNLGSTLSSKKHCGKSISGPSVLVPPTWNKTEYHEQLGNVWKRAAEELATAENIFVIGYSLPETDSFFRYLFALGSESSTLIKRFWVFNPDSSGEVEKRFRVFIGKGIENRFKLFKNTFQEAIPIIGDALSQNPGGSRKVMVA